MTPSEPKERARTLPRSARAVAMVVLSRVTDEGAFASRALDAELRRARLSPRDAALATEIVYGALRVLPALDAAYEPYLRGAVAQLDAVVRAGLRAGSYQLCALDRVPAHAVVDETVGFVRERRGPRLAGLVNAVLRKVAAQAPPLPRALCVPDWVRQECAASLGAERSSALLDERTLPPPIGLRVRLGADREALARALQQAHPEASVSLGATCSRTLLVSRIGDVRALAQHAAGELTVQEEGSQLVACYLGARAGERVADLCAGHGGKTTLLAEQVGQAGQVVALELDDRKLERIGRELARLGLPEARVERCAVDLSVGTGGLDASFDRVLLDAPCTGLGTLHRRPELLWKLAATDPARLAELQLALARNAARLVKTGGVLVIAVCSVSRAEGAELCARFCSEHPELVPEHAAPTESPGLFADTDGLVRIGPWLHPGSGSPDAYQLLRLRRRQ